MQEGDITIDKAGFPPPCEASLTFGPKGKGFGVSYPVSRCPNAFQRWALQVVFGVYVTPNKEGKRCDG